MLADIGGGSLEEFIKRVMKFLFTDSLARQFNLTGQGQKLSFASLALYDALHGLFYYYYYYYYYYYHHHSEICSVIII